MPCAARLPKRCQGGFPKKRTLVLKKLHCFSSKLTMKREFSFASALNIHVLALQSLWLIKYSFSLAIIVAKMQRSGKILASEILLYYHGEFGISTTALEQNEDKGVWMLLLLLGFLSSFLKALWISKGQELITEINQILLPVTEQKC